MPAFTVFKRQGRTFLAVPHNDGVAVIDSEGFNYGAYFSIKSFEDFTKRNFGIEACRLGRASVAILHHTQYGEKPK